MSKAGDRVMAARTALVLDQPFFGVLALRLRVVEDPSCLTAWVDGSRLGYNPDFVMSLSSAEIMAVICHEVMHCACGHPWSRDGREHYKWNQACDYAINPILVDSGFKLPDCALLDSAFEGKNAEWIYDRLPSQDEQNGGKSGSGSTGSKSESDPLGEVRDAGNSGDYEESESDWKQAVEQAAKAAKARGQLSGSLEHYARTQTQSRVDWRSVLRRFVQQAGKSDYSWQRPNRRYLVSGLYLPALWSEELGPLAVAIDTSGSIDDVLLGQFMAEIQAIADEMHPERVHVLYCDAAVYDSQTFERGEPITVASSLRRGGTDFRPVFEVITELDDTPVALVYLTDLDGSFPAKEPGFPVLWITPHDSGSAPFGEIVSVC